MCVAYIDFLRFLSFFETKVSASDVIWKYMTTKSNISTSWLTHKYWGSEALTSHY